MEDGGVDINSVDHRRAERRRLAAMAERELIHRAAEAASKDRVDLSSHAVVKGVTATWLGTVFHMDYRTVTHRLKNCPPLTRQKGGKAMLYDLPVAASFLIKPQFDVEDYLKTMKVEEMPTKLQEGYWAAALKRQKWEENAKHLWRTDEVAKRFSETFLMIANALRVWVDDLESVQEVTPAQRKFFDGVVAQLQESIAKKVSEMPKVVRPQRAEIQDTPSGVKQLEDMEDDDIDADIRDVV